MNNCFTIIAADPPADKSTGSNFLGNPMILIFLMFVMMYFLIIRPQSKQRKEQAARVASLEKGDKIITIGGLHGVIHHVGKSTVTIKLAEGVFVPFEKESVRTVTKMRSDKKDGESAGEEEEGGDEKK